MTIIKHWIQLARPCLADISVSFKNCIHSVHTIKKNNHALASESGSQGQSGTINRKNAAAHHSDDVLTNLCAIDEFNLRERYLRIFGVYAALKSKQQSRYSQNGKRLKKYPDRYPQPRSNFADILVCNCDQQSESRTDWLLKELADVRPIQLPLIADLSA